MLDAVTKGGEIMASNPIGEFIRKNQETEAGSILINTFFTECKEKGLTTIYQPEDVSKS